MQARLSLNVDQVAKPTRGRAFMAACGVQHIYTRWRLDEGATYIDDVGWMRVQQMTAGDDEPEAAALGGASLKNLTKLLEPCIER